MFRRLLIKKIPLLILWKKITSKNYTMFYDILSSNFNCMLCYAMIEQLKYKFYFKSFYSFFLTLLVDTLQDLSFLFPTLMHREKMPSCCVLVNMTHNCIGRFDMFILLCKCIKCTVKFGYLVFLYNICHAEYMY